MRLADPVKLVGLVKLADPVKSGGACDEAGKACDFARSTSPVAAGGGSGKFSGCIGAWTARVVGNGGSARMSSGFALGPVIARASRLASNANFAAFPLPFDLKRECHRFLIMLSVLHRMLHILLLLCIHLYCAFFICLYWNIEGKISDA